jgi:hypothetical protein
VIFIDENGEGPGVRLRKSVGAPADMQAVRPEPRQPGEG